MLSIQKALLLSSFLLITGCAHHVDLTPNTDKIKSAKNKSEQVVAYYISDADKAKKVTSPGGGGDKISYLPYKDIETSFYSVLSSKFKDVFSAKSLDEVDFFNEKNISLIFTPTIETDSSSDSAFTWPATSFTVKLTCKAIDREGNLKWEKTVEAEGKAEYEEFVTDFSLSSRRAVEAALNKLVDELDAADFK